MVLETSFYLNYTGNKSRQKVAFAKVRQTIPCMQDFYARHGIKLSLTIKGDGQSDESDCCDHSINLHDQFDRVDSSNWAINQTVGTILTPETRCTLYLHEMNHRLGLDDTYSDPDCPDREKIMPGFDIMAAGFPYPDFHVLYPYAIDELLGPLCGKISF